MRHMAEQVAVWILGGLALAGWASCTLSTAGERTDPMQTSTTSSSAGSGHGGAGGVEGAEGGDATSGGATSGGGGATSGAGGMGGGPGCGDGVADGAEECDDGNANNEDGCTDECVVVCPADWTKSDSHHCYARIAQTYTWDEANDVCALGPGFHLATLTTMEEVALATSLLPASTETWLGGTDAPSEGTWTWVTGETWDWVDEVSPWNAGEPNDAWWNEDCVLLQFTGGLNDHPCDYKHDPLCEFTPPGT
jgi:cysteine-rich repeat protein